MILKNLYTLDNKLIDIGISKNLIVEANSLPSSSLTLNLEGTLVFPGLINSHDHLDFNLFPQLGNRQYEDYTEWAYHIHANYRNEIQKVLEVPLPLRIQWGLYKNLLNGFTTVVNHGYPLPIPKPFIRVHQDLQSLHSLAFERRWKWKLNHPLKRTTTCAIHIGEGINSKARQEIDQIVRWNLHRRRLIGVHGIPITAKQTKNFEALCWCPASNEFMFQRTAAVDLLAQHTKLLFGTDSTLTAPWNAWEQLRVARRLTQLSDEAFLEMLTTNPAAVWQLDRLGSLNAGMLADLVVVRNIPGKRAWDRFYAINPQDILLVIQNGQIRLYDDSLTTLQPSLPFPTSFNAIEINDAVKFVEGDLPQLAREIKHYYPEAVLPFQLLSPTVC